MERMYAIVGRTKYLKKSKSDFELLWYSPDIKSLKKQFKNETEDELKYGLGFFGFEHYACIYDNHQSAYAIMKKIKKYKKNKLELKVVKMSVNTY